ncbi:fumarate reductase [Purpureocillium lavendulum]|uniref:Fumarate reductase n=1 Tax=Purpureocillium lavendulum TaxID=1247861 RepID=A0AB34G3Y3_9HYPO|nr:fumarate reductase [Purpureocillium lavendulum]
MSRYLANTPSAVSSRPSSSLPTAIAINKQQQQQQQQHRIHGAGALGAPSSHRGGRWPCRPDGLLLRLRAGSPVILLERAAAAGGNSIKASSGINGAPTIYQTGPTPDTFFYQDTIRSAGARMRSAEGPQREALISQLTNRSAAAIDFLVDDIGVDLSVVSLMGGHSVARTHRGSGKNPPGWSIVKTMLDSLKHDVRFQLRTEHEVTRLLTSHKDKGGAATVTGVEISHQGETSRLDGPVVFTTGGFAGDADGLLARYRPDLAGCPTTNSPRPGMHNLLTAVGAELVDMESVQIHPTGFVDPTSPNDGGKFLAAEMLRGEGGILLYKGKRFVNEMGTREHVSDTIMRLPLDREPIETGGSAGPRQWDIQLLLDPGAFSRTTSNVNFYLGKGLMAKKKVKDLDETTRETLGEYSAVVAGQRADGFGRTAFGHWRLKWGDDVDEAEVYVGRVTPVVHFTMGGAVIDEKSQVMASKLGAPDPKPVAGLWAAGEITGGIHGDNRLGGSSLLECVVYGLIAGEEASKHGRTLAAADRASPDGHAEWTDL